LAADKELLDLSRRVDQMPALEGSRIFFKKTGIPFRDLNAPIVKTFHVSYENQAKEHDYEASDWWYLKGAILLCDAYEYHQNE